MDLTAIYLLLLPAALYLRALRVLGRRGYRVPPLQSACWFGGLTLMGIALLSPLDRLGETDLLSAHMAQHLLIGDLAAPLILLGLRSPVYAFLLPRPLLVPIARSDRLRRLFRFLRQPWVAAPIWIVTSTAGTFPSPTRRRCAPPPCTRSSIRPSSSRRCWSGSRCSSPPAGACPASCGRSPTSPACGSRACSWAWHS